MAKKKLYDETSIESLDPREFTRLRAGVYCGDTAYATQLLIEIVSNAVDEFRLGNGNKIEVNINKEIVSVRDYGQGFITNHFRDDGKTILEAAFSVINTSGKYREDGTYEGTSLGSFGIGSKLTNFLSNWLIVETYRDGKFEKIKFDEGIFAEREVGEDTKSKTGTLVKWKASKEFFTNPIVEIEKVKSLFKTITCLCPGLTIELNNNKEKITYFSKNGLDDLADDYLKDKELLNNRFKMNMVDGKNKMDLVLTYSTAYSSTVIPYVNTGLTESGPHIVQLRAVITREFNKFFRDKGWLKDKDENLNGDDIQEGMFLIFNITAPNVAYNAQVKSTITKIEMKPFVNSFSEHLSFWLMQNEKDVKTLADKALNARKAREAAKKAKDAVRDVGTTKKNKLLNLPTKLVDAWSKSRDKCELLICEGDSAANGLVKARNSEFQAIFPIRGKIINFYKATDERAFSNQEAVNIIKAIGLELDQKTKKLIFDEHKLRYGKIILATDADPDGQAIKNLLLTYFWSICPELVVNGYIYCAIPPLFRITTKKNEYIFLRDASALEEYKKKHNKESFLINRNKGLGEQDASELKECLLEPSTRNVQQIIVDDYEKADDLFNIFMGTAVEQRRDWILTHSDQANDL